ncbi:phosphate/phosphite/phosphonate ABC transporter substrate-binding protein [Aliiruegeria sabulilitoris]|uniref:phosphate/phosphite/phosphonate ABC transporter substrate-binding protein n=1 Tax=Aliiruegeria sabulilitoris TaxID=1510458 RepID=UPI000833108C|nr:PhnD/SsuA/transferrin family substrate-binding protein [Aliiruegeria sabulilitoris]NDR59110.1 PhnD/SsuA/transferrin family substrate-binding protein [Pseudoruegeria sp. M32A2M]
MFAALPMYDHPGVRAETDALWAAIRDRLRDAGIAAPQELLREDDLHAQWESPELLLGQTCGLPFRIALHHRVTLLGSIDYDLPETPPGHYHSIFVARKDDPRNHVSEFDGALLAFNDRWSHSGWATACAEPVRFRPGPETGSHRDSARAVTSAEADIAALDAISLRLIEQHTDFARGLKRVGRSGTSPGQAIITAYPEYETALRSALVAGIAGLPEQTKSALGIRGVVQTPPQDYLAVPNPPSPEAYAAAAA